MNYLFKKTNIKTESSEFCQMSKQMTREEYLPSVTVKCVLDTSRVFQHMFEFGYKQTF